MAPHTIYSNCCQYKPTTEFHFPPTLQSLDQTITLQSCNTSVHPSLTHTHAHTHTQGHRAEHIFWFRHTLLCTSGHFQEGIHTCTECIQIREVPPYNPHSTPTCEQLAILLTGSPTLGHHATSLTQSRWPSSFSSSTQLSFSSLHVRRESRELA